MKSKCFIIPLVVYPFDVIVSVDEKDSILLKRLLNYEGTTNEDCEPLMKLPTETIGRCVMLPSNLTVIRLKNLPKKNAFISNVVHEIFHATTFIMDRVGMRLEINVSDEAYAYLIAYLSKEIFKRL